MQGRSYEQLTIANLKNLGKIAAHDRDNLFRRKPKLVRLYSDRLFTVAPRQGAALHYLDGKNGIKDSDVWRFMRKLVCAFLLILPAYTWAEDDAPNYDFYVYPPDAAQPRYEDSVRYEGKEYAICYQTFVTELLESEGLLDDIKAIVPEGQQGYSAAWEIKNETLLLTRFRSVSDLANQQIQQLIDDKKGYLAAYWYTGEIVLGENIRSPIAILDCRFKDDTPLKKLSISGGTVTDEAEISIEEYHKPIRDLLFPEGKPTRLLK